MLDIPIIEVAIGLVFFYVLLSLVCSSIQEVIAGLVGLRSMNLQQGIENLIGDCYAKSVYKHPLISGLSKPGKLPSYIKPEAFAAALLAVIIKDKTDNHESGTKDDDLLKIIKRVDSEFPVRDLLLSLLDYNKPGMDDLKGQLAKWFENGMNRVSGWYKRQVQYLLLGIATVVTIAVNADSIHIAKQLWKDNALRTTIASKAAEVSRNGNINEVYETHANNTFPIGYPEDFSGVTLDVAIGWILTIAAISLGAPFWFDLLSKVSHLRASGPQEANRANDNETAVAA